MYQNDTSPADLKTIERIQLIFRFLMVLVAAIAVFLNAFIIIVSLIRHPKYVTRRYRFLVMPICFYDTLLITTYSLFVYPDPFAAPRVMLWLCLTATIGLPFGTTALALNRLVAVVIPMSYETWFSEQRTIVLSIGAFLLPLAINITRALSPNPIDPTYLFELIVSMSCSFVCYGFYMATYWRLKRHNQHNNLVDAESRQMVHASFCLGICPFVLQLPSFVAHVTYYLVTGKLLNDTLSVGAITLSVAAAVCYYLNTIVDGICLLVFVEGYRVAFLDFCRLIFKRKKPNQTVSLVMPTAVP